MLLFISEASLPFCGATRQPPLLAACRLPLRPSRGNPDKLSSIGTASVWETHENVLPGLQGDIPGSRGTHRRWPRLPGDKGTGVRCRTQVTPRTSSSHGTSPLGLNQFFEFFFLNYIYTYNFHSFPHATVPGEHTSLLTARGRARAAAVPPSGPESAGCWARLAPPAAGCPPRAMKGRRHSSE